MVRLAIVTCGPQLEVALETTRTSGNSVVRLLGVSRRSSLLMAAIDLLVEDAGAQPGDIESVIVSRGPGSFTGIRAGLASAAGLARATGAEVVAYDSLLTQAARIDECGEIWTAQPGRRGELYAQPFSLALEQAPRTAGDLRILTLDEARKVGPWIAPEGLDLEGASRAAAVRSAAEALLVLAGHGLAGQAVEALYVEGPPVTSG